MTDRQSVQRFGTFEFDTAAGELRRTGPNGRAGVVRLEPQPAKALALLLARPGDIVSRDDLKRALWGDDVHVDFDRGLAYCIAQVRTALGDSAENPRFVETLPRRGFRFIAPVSGVPVAEVPVAQLPPPPAKGTSRSWLRSRPVPALAALGLIAALIVVVTFMVMRPRPILAVAIFDNETGRPEYDRFTSGLSDALVAHLGTLDPSRVGVIGNARSLRMPRSERDLAQIRTELGASFILLGQLQNTDGGLRLITHLIRLDDGTHVAVARFDRSSGLDGLEAEVLREVESGVRTHVMGSSFVPR